MEHHPEAPFPQAAKSTPRTKRVVRNGAATNSLVFSASTEGKDPVVPRILALYVKPGSIVAAVTYGKGVFWQHIPAGQYDLRATDIQDGIACRHLPYTAGTIDCVVLDPPYMHTPGGTAHQTHPPFEAYSGNNGAPGRTQRKYHEAVLELYEGGAREAARVLRDRGVLIVKCQDEVCSNRQRFTHVEIMALCERLDFVAEDLFVVLRRERNANRRDGRRSHSSSQAPISRRSLLA